MLNLNIFFAAGVAEKAIKDSVIAQTTKNLGGKFYTCFPYVYKIALIYMTFCSRDCQGKTMMTSALITRQASFIIFF